MNLLHVAIAITIVFGILRFTLPVEGKINKRDIFKDLAHIWVGMLLGAAIAMTAGLTAATEFWVLAIGITILEVVAFLVRKGESDAGDD